MATWAVWLMSLAAPLARRVLVGLGLSVVTYAGVGLATDQVFGYAKAALGGMSADVVQILALSGIFDAFGILAGAVVAALAAVPLKRILPDGA